MSALHLESPAEIRLSGAADELAVVVGRIPQRLTRELQCELSPDETMRAEKMGSRVRQTSYLATRLLTNRMLRETFGNQRLAADSPTGAPTLLGEGRAQAASISHSWGWMAGAATSTPALGVDLELSPRRRNLTGFGRRFAWSATGHAEFLRRWSLWEAVGKSQGVGALRPRDPLFERLLAVLENREAGRIAEAGGSIALWLPVSTGWLSIVAPETSLERLQIRSAAAQFRFG